VSHDDTPIGRFVKGLDERLGLAKITKSQLNYVFPEHFSFLWGEIALYSFIVLVATGIFLMLFYSPSETEVIYEGSYLPLRGQEVTEAYRSVVQLSFDVRAGLLMRQTHHWAALVFNGAIAVHLCRVFFTGAFRKPREVNWVTGVILMIVAMLEGLLGYSLLDDLLSGAGVRIMQSVAQSIPVIGTHLVFFIWNGEYPGEGFLQRIFTVHIFLFPLLLFALIGVHLLLIVRQKHTQFPGKLQRNNNVVGVRMWPTYATMSTGLALIVSGLLFLMGGLFQINPVWLYGPYDPFTITSGAQADYYVLWLQGALRLMPPWETRAFGHVIANPFFPGIVIPGILFGTLLFWPWIEASVTKDWRIHHLLERPRDRPERTGLGVAVMTFVAQLLIAGADDVIAVEAGWDITTMRSIERILLLILPVLTGLLAYKIASDIRHRDELQGPREREVVAEVTASRDSGGPVPVGRRLLGSGMLVAIAGALADRLRGRG
jgi:ubiquinol-cytochrome c reductase cytochrome b subunit